MAKYFGRPVTSVFQYLVNFILPLEFIKFLSVCLCSSEVFLQIYKVSLESHILLLGVVSLC